MSIGGRGGAQYITSIGRTGGGRGKCVSIGGREGGTVHY